MNYVISDLHGCYNDFLTMLNIINFSDNDFMYVLGDVIDRGDEPILCLEHVKNSKNMILLMGNHEDMMANYFNILNNEGISYASIYALHLWYQNGGEITHRKFLKLDEEKQNEYLEYINSLPLYHIYDDNTLLVHAGIYPRKGNIKQILMEQDKDAFIWIRREFITSETRMPFKIYFGHTPISYVQDYVSKQDNIIRRVNPALPQLFESYDGKAYHFNNKVAIDGGCVYNGKLICIRLDDGEEFAI